jgi:hypothetical protein
MLYASAHLLHFETIRINAQEIITNLAWKNGVERWSNSQNICVCTFSEERISQLPTAKKGSGRN